MGSTFFNSINIIGSTILVFFFYSELAWSKGCMFLFHNMHGRGFGSGFSF